MVAVVVIGALTAAIRGKDKDVPRVTTAKVEKLDLVSKVTANGKIQAQRKVDMSALVMGQIVNLAVKEGDHVKKGQLLLQIDRAQLAAQAAGAARRASAAMRHDLDAAKATAEQAKLDYERASQQHKGNILAEADHAEGEVEPRDGGGEPRRHRGADELDHGGPGGQPRLPVEDDGDGADRGHRHLAARSRRARSRSSAR